MTHRTLFVSAEGHSELEFVQSVLRPHLFAFGIYCKPILLGAARNKRRGGITSIGDCVAELRRLNEIRSNTDWLTTIYDFADFDWLAEGLRLDSKMSVLDKVSLATHHLQNQSKIQQRFIPYFQLHQFEALLFVKPSVLNDKYEGLGRPIEQMESVLHDFSGNPENINSEEKPAQRMAKILGGLSQRLKGKTLAELVGRIGLSDLRQACPNFNHWITRLEQIQ